MWFGSRPATSALDRSALWFARSRPSFSRPRASDNLPPYVTMPYRLWWSARPSSYESAVTSDLWLLALSPGGCWHAGVGSWHPGSLRQADYSARGGLRQVRGEFG